MASVRVEGHHCMAKALYSTSSGEAVNRGNAALIRYCGEEDKGIQI